MGKKKKDTIEFRFYEIPQNEYVLALLGESWIRDYGHDETNLHFHNLMEVGYCIDGRGKLILEEEEKHYEPDMVSVIPQNFPHITISADDDRISYWEYLFFDPLPILQDMYPENPLHQRELSEKINSRAFFGAAMENRNLAMTVQMIMDEMRGKKPHYKEVVKGMMRALVTQILRINEADQAVENDVRKKTRIMQISDAVEYVRVEYARNLKIEDLAEACHMSETHFRRVFKETMNMSPMDYINLIRVQKACDLMKKTNYSMDVVAEKVGFSNTSTFNRNFKKFLDTSPYQWKINPENYEGRLLNFHISALKGW